MKNSNFKEIKFNLSEFLKTNTKRPDVLDVKYITSILNKINSLRGSQTGKYKVGNLSALFEKYKAESQKNDIQISSEGWRTWYLSQNIKLTHGVKKGQELLDEAVKNNKTSLKLMKEMLNKIEAENAIKPYINELMFEKTFYGLSLEKPIIHRVFQSIFGKEDYLQEVEKINKPISKEAKGIDFEYLTKTGKLVYFSIKPITYKKEHYRSINQKNIQIIYYEKKQNKVNITFNKKEIEKLIK